MRVVAAKRLHRVVLVLDQVESVVVEVEYAGPRQRRRKRRKRRRRRRKTLSGVENKAEKEVERSCEVDVVDEDSADGNTEVLEEQMCL